ncbi:HAD-IC family P-type ATPase [Marinitenerispora sediminis]|uniref:Magnesium-transporting ATPase n=1 Tax=Marinitenerispora sediminis TaxID=1931232 RepID=A0A368T9T0_9ACTN|nr:HAD-IC family P-type ATPase [Marinitenerispora sediminis]RCV52423.1 magnesium-transporting ATPase [Marinitenerispora sediminis]RCV60621.1 magnesium-transporting ATPase [Marinitenerispora sediminis]RCV61094.1 magnesium-transporting ATPase [Marinitenerispora sediminis]
MAQDSGAVPAGPPAPDAARGLTAGQVAERVAAGRTNDVPVRAARTVGQIVRANLFTRINAMIAVLFGIIAVIGPVQDGLFALVIVFNTLIGIVQELRAKRTLDRLAIVNAVRPRVVRDGAVARVSAQEVVLDDVLEFAQGDQAVVDGVVLDSAGLEVDESLLTGEADPVVKRPGDPVMSGSFAVAGSGRFRATKVGRAAYAARLAEEASRFTLVDSELRSGMDRLLRFITWLLFPTGALLVYSQLYLGGHVSDGASLGGTVSGPLADALRGTVAALVSMVPEGLVLLISIAYAVGVVRLGRRGCLVQELPAIEGLARVDVVCTDKTGTLTENGMRVAEVREVGRAGRAGRTPPVADVLAALAAADPRPNPSMAAIGEMFPEPPDWPVAAVVPFSSARGWSGAAFSTPEGTAHWVLGAPDVLGRPGERVTAEAERLGARGLRVLLLGRGSGAVAAPDDPGAPGAVEPVALVVLEQRVRADAADTLRYFAEQDVEVKVVSGDNAAAVGAVARGLGLPGAGAPVDARDLPDDPEELADRVRPAAVFGRVSPERKRAMVRGLRSRGRTVAMTGDGVNDVLALKEADIGVAMGSGSPAARAVAQIVLLDDRFATLPHVVAEGRRVIGNIERVANLFLTKTVYSMTMVTVVGLLGVAYPFFPRHATLINALTFGIPSFFLALASNGERARPGFVRRTLRLAVPAGIVSGLAAVASYLLALDGAAAPDLADRTAPVITLCATTLWVLLLVARPYVWWKALLVAGMAGALLTVLLTPAGRSFFALDISDPAAVATALVVAACAAALITVVRVVDDRLSRRAERAPARSAAHREPARAGGR